MKQLSLGLLFFVSVFTFSGSFSHGAEWDPNDSDRVEIAPDKFGVKWTDSFEYVCTYATDKKTKHYLDIDFVDSKGQRFYRYAKGFHDGEFYNGVVAIEETILSSSRARGLKFNLILTLADSSCSDNNYTLEFLGDPSAENLKVTLKGTDDSIFGTCEKNEIY